jgi:hypothetical protein
MVPNSAFYVRLDRIPAAADDSGYWMMPFEASWLGSPAAAVTGSKLLVSQQIWARSGRLTKN